MNAPIENSTVENLNSIIDIDLRGPIYFCKLVSPIMKEQNMGKIINIASIGGMRGTYGQSVYGAAKAGLVGFTKCLGIELASFNINVNAIAPGVIETFEERKDSYAELAKIIPSKRVGKSIDIAKTVVFLASEDSNFIVGQTVVVDGGHSNIIFYNPDKYR